MAIAIGPLYVRRALYIDKQPASIWQKFETLSGLNSWYGIGHTIDSFVQGANGSIELSVDIDNVRARFGGPTLFGNRVMNGVIKTIGWTRTVHGSGPYQHSQRSD